MSHPVGTLHRWSSSHHVLCSGPPLRVTRAADRGHGGRGPGAAARRRGGSPALRSRAGRRAAGLARGCRLRRRRGPRRARAAPLPRTAPVARLARRAGAASEAGADRPARPVPAGAHAVAPARAHRRDPRPAWATRSTHCGPPATTPRCARSSRCRRRRARRSPRRWRSHARNLTGLVPRFAPGWMPRTNDRVAIPLGGGRIVLHGMFDLVVGLPQPRHRVALRAGALHRRPLGGGAAVTALPVAARDPPERHSPVPAGAARVRLRPLRRRGRARGAPPGDRLAHRRLARPRPLHRPMDSRLMDALGGARPRRRRRRRGAPPSRRRRRSWPAWPSGAPAPSASASPITRCAPPSPSTRPTIRVTASRSPGPPARRGDPSAWPPSACCSAGTARSPLEAVRSRLAESSRWVREGSSSRHATRPLGRRPPAGRPCRRRRGGRDLGHPPVVCPRLVRRSPRRRSSAATTGGTAPIPRCWRSAGAPTCARRTAHLVVLSGPRRGSVRAELALVTLVEALRLRGDDVPGRVVGWWPDSGHLVRVEPEPAVLTLGTEAVELALGGAGTSLRSAA